MSKKQTTGGLPYGTMVPPKPLTTALNGLVTKERNLLESRKALKRDTLVFYRRFHKAHPGGTLADFARQFDESVPMTREGYKKNRTFIALENMFRYLKVKVGSKKGSSKAAKSKKTQRKATPLRAAVDTRTRMERLFVSVCQQIGIAPAMLVVAFQRVGLDVASIDAMFNRRGNLKDVGFGVYQLVVRAKDNGKSAMQAYAESNRKQADAAKAVPTQAEAASMAKGKPTVKPNGKAVTLVPSDNLFRRTMRNPSASVR
jgi:hypothetical protein